MHKILQSLLGWYQHALEQYGYPVVVLFMAIESSIVPLPSEVIIPPAAHLAHIGKIPLTVWGVVLAGMIGSWLGASVMYWVARIGGRLLLARYGRYLWITPGKISDAENWSRNYGSMAIFMSRLLPVVRHLIGIPAGIVKMNYTKYSLYTILGSGIWCTVLAYVGIKAGENESLMKGELRSVTLWLGGGMIALGAMYYFFVYRQMKRKKP